MPTRKPGTAKKASAKKAAAKNTAAKRTTAKNTAASTRNATPRANQRPSAKLPSTKPWVPPPPIGAHVSSAGGSHETPGRARDIGASAFQLFTKQASQWAEHQPDAERIRRFADARAAHPVAFIVAHDSYLINLASPNPVLRRRSIESFVAELRRSDALGLDGIVSHPGNYMDEREAGLARNADAITEALEAAPGHARLFLETTAGTGTSLGATFEELATIIARIPAALRARVGVCVDTCHVYSAGYDLVTDYDGVWARFDDTIGRDRLGVMHLNDSRTPFGARRDRHELIAEGSLGAAPFRRIMTDSRLAAIPKILETPKGDDMVTNDRIMLARLRSYAAGQ